MTFKNRPLKTQDNSRQSTPRSTAPSADPTTPQRDVSSASATDKGASNDLRWGAFRNVPAPTTTPPKASPISSPRKVSLVTPSSPIVPGPSKLEVPIRALTPNELEAVAAVDDVARPGRSASNKRLKTHKQRRGTLYFAVSEEEEQLIRGYCQLHNVPLSRFVRAAVFAAMGQVMPRRR